MASMCGRLVLCALAMVACGTNEGIESATGAASERDASESDDVDLGAEPAAHEDEVSLLDAGQRDAQVRDLRDASHAAEAGVDAGTAMDAALPMSQSDGALDGSEPSLQDASVDASPRDASIRDSAVDAASPRDATLPDANIPPEQTFYSSFTRVYAILDQSCNNSCHTPGAAYSLDLSTRLLAYLELVGEEGKGNPMEFITCANKGLFRVVPGSPAQSVLIQKLESTQPCGDRMPPGGSLAASSIAEIRAWISRGAPND